MKLRNKKTGKIIEKYPDRFVVNSGEQIKQYNSLAELNSEWEDYEEPKEYWFINDLDGTPMKCELRSCVRDFTEWMEKRKEIGNYFETREEAEKVVEKLKAWKRLKDECDIKFDGIIRGDNGMLKAVKLSYDRHEVTFDRMRECMDALHLIFGGEE